MNSKGVDATKESEDLPNIILSNVVIEGLESMGRSLTPPDVIESLAEHSVELLLETSSHSIDQAKSDNNKQDALVPNSDLYEYCLSSLYSVAIKHQLERKCLQQFLERRLQHLNPEMMQLLLDVYERNRNKLTEKFATIGGNGYPHVTDIKWRQMTTVKSSSMNGNRRSSGAGSDGEVTFLINMGCFREASHLQEEGEGERKTIAEFVCNTEEMQMLINKLKEVQRHCVKFSSE